MRLLPHAPLRRALLVAAALCILLLLALTVQAHTAGSVASAVTPADDTATPTDDIAAPPPAVSAAASPSAAAAALPEFVATDEWQPVLPGQSVPAGLWMRVDMTTGERMARLLPEEERNDYAKRRDAEQQLAIVSEEDAAAPSASPSSLSDGGPSIRELAAPGSEQSPASSAVESALHDAALLSARRARLAALRETFFLKEEVEQMKSLLAICIEPTATVSDVVAALSGLEEFVHQVDNANDFAVIGGFDIALTLAQQRINEEPKDAAAARAAAAAEEPTTSAEETAAAIAAAAKDDAVATSLDAIVEETIPVTTTADVLSSTAEVNVTDAANTTDVAGDADSAAAEDGLPAPLSVQAARLYELQMHAAWVIGTAAQNNRRVQDEAHKQKAIQVLTELLRDTLAEEHAAAAADVAGGSSLPTDSHAGDSDVSGVRSGGFDLRLLRMQLLGKLLYALSSLMRHHAANQAAFFHAHGADVLRFTLPLESWPRCAETAADGAAGEAGGSSSAAAAIADGTSSSSASPSRSVCLTAAEFAHLQRTRWSVQIKAIALVHDLIIDHTLNAASSTDSATAAATAAADAAAAAAQAPSAQPHVSRAALSDPSLFSAFTSDEWCAHLLSSLDVVDGAPLLASLSSVTLDRVFTSLHAVLQANERACRSVLTGDVGQRFQPVLRAFAQLHEAEAAHLQRNSAEAAAEGKAAEAEDWTDDAAHHRTLSEAAAAILHAANAA